MLFVSCVAELEISVTAMQVCVLSVSLEYVTNSATGSCDWIIISL